MKKEYINTMDEYGRNIELDQLRENTSLPREYFETGFEVYEKGTEFFEEIQEDLEHYPEDVSYKKQKRHSKLGRKMVYGVASVLTVLAISQTLPSSVGELPMSQESETTVPEPETVTMQTITITGTGELTRELVNAEMSRYELQETYKIIVKGNVTRIGRSAFEDCDNVYAVELPDTVTSIAEYAFVNCGELVSVVMPDTDLHIGSNAFANCYKLVFETVDTGELVVEAFAFANTTIRNLIVRESAGEGQIDSHNLYVGVAVENIVFEEGITRIPDYILGGTRGYSTLTLPETVTVIGYGAFGGCSELQNIILPNGLKSIADMAFYGCKGLGEMVIPDGLEYIGTQAFDFCDNVVLSVMEGSPAQEYAELRGIRYTVR